MLNVQYPEIPRWCVEIAWLVGFSSPQPHKTRHPKCPKCTGAWWGISVPRRIENMNFPRSRRWSGPGAAVASPRRDLSIRAASLRGLVGFSSPESHKTRHPKCSKQTGRKVGVSASRRNEEIDFPRSRSWSGPGAALASPRRDLSIRAAARGDRGGLTQND